ncbi:hypothetical protein ACOSQ3_019494 [Xanthoceras sorbifolium]
MLSLKVNIPNSNKSMMHCNKKAAAKRKQSSLVPQIAEALKSSLVPLSMSRIEPQLCLMKPTKKKHNVIDVEKTEADITLRRCSIGVSLMPSMQIRRVSFSYVVAGFLFRLFKRQQLLKPPVLTFTSLIT